jgi:hypothetical protein
MPMRSQHLRRTASAAAITAALIGALFWKYSVVRPASRNDVMLLYVGADDCPPCRAWKRGPGAAFRASPEFSRLIYREVDSPTVLNLLSDQYWPDDLREYRERLGRNAGVPLWLLVADHQVVERGFGESQWREIILPKLKVLLR